MNYVESGHESFGLINREELKIILLGVSLYAHPSICLQVAMATINLDRERLKTV